MHRKPNVWLEDLARVAQGVSIVVGKAVKRDREVFLRTGSNFFVVNQRPTRHETETDLGTRPFPTPQPPPTDFPFTPPAQSAPIDVPLRTPPDELDPTRQTPIRETTEPVEPVQRFDVTGGTHVQETTESVEPVQHVEGSQPVEHGQGSQPPKADPSAIYAPLNNFSPRETHVPSSPLGRVMGFGGIAMRLALGTLADAAGSPFRDARPHGHEESWILTEGNADRLVEGLCRMRGAALKIGQMLSIQEHTLPPALKSVFQKVRDSADVMPRDQLESVLAAELGDNWSTKLKSFNWKPIGAASIGQVHTAELLDGTAVAIKIQYPGVADSINSDINNVKRLFSLVNVLPKGLYLDHTMRAAKEELALECDYEQEAESQIRMRILLQGDTRFNVPRVHTSYSTKRVLTSDLVRGVPIDKLAGMDASKLPGQQTTRNQVASDLLRLTLRELFEFRFMQTDPNWSNFLYDPVEDVTHLIDFGASREYRPPFVDEYLRMVEACANKNRDQLVASSIKLGFLTGDESSALTELHVKAGYIVGEPFAHEGVFKFAQARLAERISEMGKDMVTERLTAPPKEAYTLHRKLSGSFLTCTKLEAEVDCRSLWRKTLAKYEFCDEPLVIERG